RILAGGGKIGSFGDNEIDAQTFGYYYEGCKEMRTRQEIQLAQYREQMPDMDFSQFMPQFNMEDCMRRYLEQTFALATIARRLGLGVSEEFVQREILEQAREYEQSQQTLLDEDKMDLREWYQLLANRHPVEVRQRERMAQMASEILSRPLHVSAARIRAEESATEITMNVRVIRYNDTILLNELKESIEPTEEEIRAKYEEERQEFGEENARPYADERSFVRERLRTEQARARMAQVKSQLGALREGATLEDVTRITGIQPSTATAVNLTDLSSIPMQDGTYTDLAVPEMLQALLPELRASTDAIFVGPQESGEMVLYVEVSNVRIPPIAPLSAETLAADREAEGQALTAQYSDFIMTEEKRRGNFQLHVNLENDLN
ncbi:MAG: hypothetical protein KDK34_13175, partial [Leptospiraceae bacterium]|nr:hypothetical protein [Leptospiraceae bacterium]